LKTKTKRYYIINLKNKALYFTSMKQARIMSIILGTGIKECYTKNSATYSEIEVRANSTNSVLLNALSYAQDMINRETNQTKIIDHPNDRLCYLDTDSVHFKRKI